MSDLEIQEQLTERFADILYTWQHPEVLSATELRKADKSEVGVYFHSNPMAYHVLRALVHAAMQITRTRNSLEPMMSFTNWLEGER